MAKSTFSWLATGGLLFAFWLLLVDSPAEPMVLAGIVIAVLGATASELVRRQRVAGLRATPGGLAALWRPAASVPGDVARLVKTLAIRRGRPGAAGRFRAIPFEPADGPEDTGGNSRQALAELAGSFSPNTIVVGIDVDRRALLVHQLVDDDSAADAIGPYASG